MKPQALLSIVVPDAYENCAKPLQERLADLKSDSRIEIIFVSKEEAPTRAERLNIGFHRTTAQIVLFHHPRSWLESAAIEFLCRLKPDQPTWGGFTHQFDISHPLLQFTSWYSNKVRGARGILYLDHCIYFHRDLWKKDLPPVAIFEDTLLSQQLLVFSKPRIENYKSTTSAVRFQKNGVWRQALMNQFLKLAFYFDMPHDRMNAIYEKGLGLNDPNKINNK